MKLSIRKFLLLNLLLAITAITSFAAIANYYLDQQDIRNNLDNLLSQAALSFQTLLSSDLNTRNLAVLQANLNHVPELTKDFLAQISTTYPGIVGTHKYQFQVWDKNGRLLLHSADAPKTPLATSTIGFSDEYINGQLWRVVTTTDRKQHLTFMLAEHYNVRNHLASVILKDEIYILLLTYPVSGILIWFIIGRGLSSMRRIADEVGQRAADRLDPVDLEIVPAEIKPLIDELNKLFLRLKQAFEREQRFSADAAHELRTPLAALKTQAQVALKATDEKERQQQLQNVIAGVDRCTHVIQQLLTLCRMSPETVTLEDPIEVDVARMAAEVIAQLAPIAVDKQIDIELIAKDTNCIIMGNATGLYALIRNLVDNAIRYTPQGGTIKVFVVRQENTLVIRVVDSGSGIPAELRARVFERFYRVLGTNTQGSGLGLAIVHQIVQLHKGTVTLKEPASGIGLEVEVTFPIQSP
jgi:two-component system sensor histidine kinase QseC